MERKLLCFFNQISLPIFALVFVSVFEANVAKAQSCCPSFKFSLPENCERPDSLCFSQSGTPGTGSKAGACKNTTQTYTVYPNLPGYTYQWTVVGGTPTSYTGNPLTMTWGNGGIGSIKVVVSQNGGNCKDSFEISVCLKDGPAAGFTAPDTVCTNQTVNFINTSIGGNSHKWNFGDGTSFIGPNPPAHIYTSPGTYIVSLTVSNSPVVGNQPNFSNCNCYDVFYDTITVISGNGPEITTDECFGTLCSTDTPLISNFSTPTVCSSYLWSVVGGTILSGQNTATISVLWSPSFSGTPSVTLTVPASCSGGCASSTTIQVPIIYPNLPIQGPDPVCVGSKNTYTMPTLPGCYYGWFISGNGSFTPGNNKFNSTNVSVDAGLLPGTYTLNCIYYDSLKMCGDTSTRTITVLPKFAISQATSTVCENSTGFYQASGNASWQVFQNGVLVPSYVIPNGSSCVINWLLPGTYQIVATSLNPSSFCNNTYSTTVEVVAKPLLTNISPLSSLVCPGDIIQYAVNSTNPDYPYVWNCTGGTILAQNNNVVTVKWSNTGGTISVFQNHPNSSLICPSNTITFNASLFATPTITGPSAACEDDIVTYSASPLGLPDYQWSITGGSIISGQGTATVQVMWAGGTGARVLTLNTCSGSATKTVTVTNKVSYPVSFNAGPNCTYTVTSSVVAPSYTWYLNGNLLPSTTQTISINSSGYYTCLPNLPCVKASGIQVTLPSPPSVNISTPIKTFCVGGTGTLPAITFNSAVSAGGAYSYQWYHNSNMIPGATNSTYTQPAGSPALSNGTYFLVVSYGAGCTAVSNTILIDTSCGGGGACTLPSAPYNMNITTTCGTNFVESFTSTPPAGTTINWNFGDGTIGTSSVGAGITHNYLSPGIFYVCATATNSMFCPVTTCVYDTVPIVPSFSVNVGCSGATLSNTSQTLAGIGAYSVSWSATGGTVTPSTGSTTTFTGSGTVTMTITYNGCIYAVSQSVNATSGGVSINNPSTACIGEPNVNAFSTIPSSYAVYTWSFGDGGTSGNAVTSHAYQSPGTYTVSVTVVDFKGCVFNNTSPITIHPLPIVNLVTSDTFICEGSTATLTATAGMNHYAWYKNDTLISSGTVNSISVSSFGIYTVVVTDANGCTKRSNKIPCIVLPNPSFKIKFLPPYSSILCANAMLSGFTLVEATMNTNYLYNWTAASPISIASPTSNSTSVIVPAGTSAGNYLLFLTVTDTTTGCSRTDSICLNVSLAPNVSIAPSASFCAGTLTLLTPSPNNTGVFDYVWSNGVTTPLNSVSSEGVYSVTITNRQSGCSATSNFVIVKPLPNLSLFPTGCDTLCDTAHLYIPLPNNNNPVAPASLYPSIDWFVDGNYTATGPFLALNTLPLGHHTVQVIVTNSDSCSNQSEIYNIFIKHCEDTCTVKALFTYQLRNDTVYFNNASSGSGQVYYQWVFGDGTTSNLTNPIHYYDSSAVYNVCLYTMNITGGDTCRDSMCMCICICQRDSSCNEFLSYIQNQNIGVNSAGNPNYVFSPPALLPTDIVRWDFTCDGITDMVTMGNSTATYTYSASGSFVACAKIERMVGKDTCWARLTTMVKPVVAQNCSCDNTFDSNVNAGFATSVSGNTVTFVPIALTNCDTVQWIFGDGSPVVTSVGNTPVTHTYSNSNLQYNVCMQVVRAGNGNCKREKCRFITLTGVANLASNNVHVYPNPTEKLLTIKTDKYLPSGVRFIIFDMTGRTLLEQLAKENANIQHLDLSVLNSGIYSLCIVQHNGEKLFHQLVAKY